MADDLEREALGGPLEPELRAALERRFGRAPAVDWPAFEARMLDRAAPGLAARARRRRWERVSAVGITAGLAAAMLLTAGLVYLPDDGESAQPVVEEVGPIAGSDLLPADPLFVTDQETFMTALLEPEGR